MLWALATAYVYTLLPSSCNLHGEGDGIFSVGLTELVCLQKSVHKYKSHVMPNPISAWIAYQSQKVNGINISDKLSIPLSSRKLDVIAWNDLE